MEISLQQVVKIANNRDYSLMTLIYDGTQEWNDNPRACLKNQEACTKATK